MEEFKQNTRVTVIDFKLDWHGQERKLLTPKSYDEILVPTPLNDELGISRLAMNSPQSWTTQQQ
ncbi:hypothetical protein PanWU01x14_247750 [Parasponia andersonii]|uniref:Uncharacterized protein n=1 Tax=Parasponia andersonii TaxID=3476 RepID=A0A2P5BE00_PARAD|nr:hypothetical protein PanWU01x14_247750 [Parasponia andersonii]